MTIGEKIKLLRTNLEMTQDELGEKIGVQKQAIYKYEQGLVVNLKRDIIAKLATALETSPAYLMGWEEPTISTSSTTFDIIGEVAASFDHEAIEELTGEKISVPDEWLRHQSPNNFFVLKVTGNSMYPDFQNGDMVLVRKQSHAEHNDIVIVIYDNNGTLKKIKIYDDKIELVPRNPEYQTKVIVGDDMKNMRIVGKVWKLIRNIH